MMPTPEAHKTIIITKRSQNLQQNQRQQQCPDLPVRTKHLCSKVNEFLYKFAHEPSLAGHRIQEHVHKTVPNLSRAWESIDNTTNQLNGVLFDLNYTEDFFDKLDDSIHCSVSTRETISELASKISAATSRVNRQSSSSFLSSVTR